MSHVYLITIQARCSDIFEISSGDSSGKVLSDFEDFFLNAGDDPRIFRGHVVIFAGKRARTGLFVMTLGLHGQHGGPV